MKTGTKILAAIGAVVALPSVVVASMVWTGYVLAIMWGWFLVPLGAPALSVPMAIGVNATVRMLTHTDTTELQRDPDRKRGFCGSLFISFAMPALFLGIGWVVSRYV